MVEGALDWKSEVLDLILSVTLVSWMTLVKSFHPGEFILS